MLQKIGQEGIVCSVFTNDKTVAATENPALDLQTVVYAGWRWLYRCRALRKPLCALCLGFRRGKYRRKSLRLVVTLPARAAQLPGDGYLHLLVRLSSEGAYLEAVNHTAQKRPGGLPHRGRRVVFH